MSKLKRAVILLLGHQLEVSRT